MIELPHQEEELRTISNAIKQLLQPGLSKEIQQYRRIIKQAQMIKQILRAYNRYLKFQIAVLQRRIRQMEKEAV